MRRKEIRRWKNAAQKENEKKCKDSEKPRNSCFYVCVRSVRHPSMNVIKATQCLDKWYNNMLRIRIFNFNLVCMFVNVSFWRSTAKRFTHTHKYTSLRLPFASSTFSVDNAAHILDPKQKKSFKCIFKNWFQRLNSTWSHSNYTQSMQKFL